MTKNISPAVGQPWNRADLILAVAILIEICLVGIYLFHGARFALHSDSATKTVLADIALTQGRFLPHDWIYANGDLPFANAHMFSLLATLLPISAFARNALAVFIAYLFFLGCYWGFSRETFGRRTALLLTALAAAGISMADMEYLVVQSAYAVYAGLALCMVVMAARTYRGVDPIASASWLGILVFWLCLSNPVRGGVQLVAPLILATIAAIIAMTVFGKRICAEGTGNVGKMLVLIVPAVGLALAWLVYFHELMPALLNYQGHSSITLAERPQIIHQLKLMPRAWMHYHLQHGDSPLFSPLQRIMAAIGFLLAAAGIIGVVGRILLVRKTQETRLWLALLAAAMICAGLVPLIISTDLYFSFYEIRYALMGSLLTLALGVDTLLNFPLANGKWQRAVITTVLAYSLVMAYVWNHPPSSDFPENRKKEYASRVALIDWLESQGVNSVLAPYWDAHVISVLSDMKIHALPIHSPGYARTFIQLSYAGKDWSGEKLAKSAVLIKSGEDTAGQRALMNVQFGSPMSEKAFGNVEALIYDHNIAYAVATSGSPVDVAVPNDQVRVSLSMRRAERCQADDGCYVRIDVHNTGTAALSSYGSKPFRIAARPMTSDGQPIDVPSPRAEFLDILAPGTIEPVVVSLSKTKNPRLDHYEFCLVQELVSWHCERTDGPIGASH